MKKLTKKQQQMIASYKYARYSTIGELYKNASCYKWQAENSILREMRENSGYDYRVIGGNSMTFSCAYRYDDKQGQTHLVYHTAYNRYDFVIGVLGGII